jgi:alpha-D-ribose 1-methylphosphonate 5-triphosphate synthase subunit PhnG
MPHFTTEERQSWMGLFARASSDQLASALSAAGRLPASSEIRAPEIGMVMVQGRIAGSGAPFNLGEMTVTRCTVTALGQTGHALVQGRRPEHARLAALLDALLQDGGWHAILKSKVVEPLKAAEAEAVRRRNEESAATKVDFFTLVRGEDKS